MVMTSVLLLTTFLKRWVQRGIPLEIRGTPPWPGHYPFISVVIPCYNHGKFLDEAIKSILSQTIQDLEIIVVNDGSTDPETLGILSPLERPKTRVIHLAQNMGLPAARNTGIRQARGKYVCCLDADDKLQATYLEKALAVMEVNAGITYVGSWTQVFGRESRVWYAPPFDPDQILYFNQFNSLAVFRRAAWEEAGGFFEEMRAGFEDWEFWVRLTGHGFRGYQIPEKLIHVRRIGDSFALRAARKKDVLFEQIKAHNSRLYLDSQAAIRKIKKSYRDVYDPRPFANLPDQRDHPPEIAMMVISDLNSTDTMDWIKRHPPAAPLVWVARQALDESAVDVLYTTTPYVYILPNFLPRYARQEFVRYLQRIWDCSSIKTLDASGEGLSGVRVDPAKQ